MHTDTLANQCQQEHQALQNLKDALRVTLDWKAPEMGRSRKLSSIAFIVRALQRHLEHQLALEERDGYMVDVSEAKPGLVQRTARLRAEHDAFRQTLRELLPDVERLSPADEAHFNALCDEIDRLLRRIDQHDEDEADLLQEALLTDEGGEG